MVCADEEQLRFKRDNLRQSLIKYAQIDPKLISEVPAKPLLSCITAISSSFR